MLAALALVIAAAIADPTVMVAGQEMGYGDMIEITTYMLDTDGKPMLRADMSADQTEAAMLAILAKAPDNSLWHPIYLAVRVDPSRVPLLAQELTLALHEMSEKMVAKQDDDRAWIVASIVRGMARAHTYALLHERGFNPTNGAYPRKVDPSSGNAMISLPGAFQPGCYWHKDVTFAFDAHNRIAEVTVSPSIPACL